MCYNVFVMKENLLLLLFPCNDYLKDIKHHDLFNKCINERYIKNGYDFCVVNYKNSKLDYILNKSNILIEYNLTEEESHKEIINNGKLNIESIYKNTVFNSYKQIVVSGFCCFNCVKELANVLYSKNYNVQLDADLTDLFDANIIDDKWDISNFSYNSKIEKLLLYKNKLPKSIFKNLMQEYLNPIWNINKNLIEEIIK